jgi:hypothetical protein
VARDVPRAAAERRREIAGLLAQAEAERRRGALGHASERIADVRHALEAAPDLPGAALLAREAALIDARVQEAAGERAATEAALSIALTLDPEATLSARDFPPALATRYAGLQGRLLASRASWPEIAVTEEPGLELEIDGRPGARPVPPGLHFVVARRPGRAPVAAIVAAGAAWAAPAAEEVLSEGLPVEGPAADRVCEALELDWIVLAHLRGDRLGLQAHRCGSGFSPRWVGPEGELARGVEALVAGRGLPAQPEGTLEQAWPRAVAPAADRPDRPPEPAPKKPWYRRAWVWVLIGGVVAGGVTTAVVLGTRPGTGGIAVSADDFLRP